MVEIKTLEERIDDFRKRQIIFDDLPGVIEINEVGINAALLLAKFHDRAHILGWGHDGGGDEWLIDFPDFAWVREFAWVIELKDGAIG